MRDDNEVADNGVRKSVYEIRVRGHLPHEWSDWFGGMEIVQTPDGESVLRGELADQGALHGVLTRIRDMGLPLLEVSPARPDNEAGSIRQKADSEDPTQAG